MIGLGAEKLLVPNVALNGEATQSSNFHHYGWFVDPDYANYAIDGKFDTDIHDLRARCALTQKETGPWWQVDLKNEYEIRQVAVTTRKHRK